MYDDKVIQYVLYQKKILLPLTFHRAKSAGFFFLESTATRSPALLSSNFLPDNRP